MAALEAERDQLSAREAALAVRERDLEKKLAELREARAAPPAPAAAASEHTEREAALEKRVNALTQREIALARRVAEANARERELEARAAQLALEAAELQEQAEQERLVVPEPEPEPEPEPAALHAAAAAPGPEQPAVDQTSGRWNLLVLERLMDERGEEFPEQRDEWSSYLYFLREYAEPDGSVPASFDWLIQDTFSDLVA
jgi:DNA repair exonuclease SbcCD ATPase subunit